MAPSNNAPVDDRVGDQVDERVDDQIGEPIGGPVDNFSDSVIHIETRSPTRSPTHSQPGSPTGQSVISSIDESVNSSSRILTDNQAIVYYCLKWLAGNATSVLTVSIVTGVNVHTVKSALQKLRKSGYIKYYGGLVNLGGRVGFSAIVKDCQIILRGSAQRVANVLKNIDWQGLLLAKSINDCVLDDPLLNHRLGPLLNHYSDQPLDHLMPPSLSSSSNSFKKPTSEELLEYLNHPEMDYWKEGRGLTVRKMEGWLKDFQINPLILFRYLCYCAFDMVILEKERELVKTPEDYFFGITKKSGFYPKPKGYQSWEEKRAAQLEKDEQEYFQGQEKMLEAEARKIMREKGKEYEHVLKAMPGKLNRQEGPMFEGTFIETYKKLKKELFH